MIDKASKVFTRVPTLKALFVEILACQGLSTLLNVCFVSALKSEIPNDDERAGWMGKVCFIPMFVLWIHQALTFIINFCFLLLCDLVRSLTRIMFLAKTSSLQWLI